ncbi:MAG: MotA/TolQ/ExbB proton channel family protein [Rhodobacteraceae bacterium]|nr:MotA/TolQ/ExbB proton channel family protein [Paracoccaceae bacterium]
MTGFIPHELSGLAWTVLGALALVSVGALTVTLFKLIQFHRLGLGRARKVRAVLDAWLRGDRTAAARAAQGGDGVRMRVLGVLMGALESRPSDCDHAQRLATQRALEELARLSANMRVLEAVVQAAPMLGLLGTVIGMIEAFGRIAQTTGAADPALLAGGIWTALITTAIGLAIAILFYFVSLWLEGRITREREALESLIMTVVNSEPVPHGFR